jgi:hypothetical protein
MSEIDMKEIWQNLSIWRKSTLVLVFIMWFAFSAGIISSTTGNLILTIVSLCLLWLVFILVAFIIARVNNGYQNY